MSLWFQFPTRLFNRERYSVLLGGSENVKVLVTQWCPTLCDLMDYSPQVSSVHEILQARILERGCPSGFPSPGDLPKPANQPLSLRPPAPHHQCCLGSLPSGGKMCRKTPVSILRVALWHQTKRKFLPPQITRWLALITRQILHGKFLSLAARDSPATSGSARHICSFTSLPFFLWLPPLPPQQVGTIFKLQWHPTPVLLPGKSHGWRSLVGCSPWVC